MARRELGFDYVTMANSFFYVVAGLILMTMIGGGVLAGATSFANDSTSSSVNATVTVGSACTLDVTEDVAHTAKGIPGTTTSDIGLSTLKTVCNDGSGYAIYAVGYSGLEFGNTKMLATISGEPSSTNDIVTGTNTSGNASNWAMKLNAVSGTYTPIIVGSSLDSERQSTTPDFSGYTAVPSTYTRIAYRNSATDAITGSSIQSTYRTYIAGTQPAGTYEGKVKYTLVHPASEVPPSPQTPTAGCINYFANASTAVGTMGCQSATDGNAITLLASNFSRDGYGFAGWSDVYDYETNPNAHFYGPQEDITVPTGTTANGLALYAVWVKSEGSLQDTTKVASVCNRLTRSGPNVTKTLNSVSALTDQRDDNTYAIAKLADGNCWMIENLRLDNTAEHNSDGTLAQGYGRSATYGNFRGLADAESSGFSSTYSANSLYSRDGSNNTINIGAIDDPAYRMPRYNSLNTPIDVGDRPQNPTSNSLGMYGYGNYYTWPAAMANTIYYSNYAAADADGKTSDTVKTSLCPTGWMLPYGRDKGNGIVSGGFYNLNYKINNNSYATDSTASLKFRSFPNNFLYSGSFYEDAVFERGTEGNYWSSTVSDRSKSYSMHLSNVKVYSGANQISRQRGVTIRCLLSF